MLNLIGLHNTFKGRLTQDIRCFHGNCSLSFEKKLHSKTQMGNGIDRMHFNESSINFLSFDL